MRADLLRIIEAGYRVDLEERPWLQGVADEARAAEPGAIGAVAWTFRGADASARETCVAAGLSAAHLDALGALEHVLRGTEAMAGRSHGLRTVAAPRRAARRSPAWRVLEDLGVHHVHFATDVDEGRGGLALVFCHQRRRRLTGVHVEVWESILRQLLRAQALRRRLGRQLEVGELTTPVDGVAAVATSQWVADVPTAEPVFEGERDARRREAQRLATAVPSSEVALATEASTVDPEASAAWQALLDGHLSIVDRFESGGRSYWIASDGPRPGGAGVRLDELDGRILRLRAEGASLKVIADELALSVSGVSRRLERAMAALALRAPSELAALFSAATLTDEG